MRWLAALAAAFFSVAGMAAELTVSAAASLNGAFQEVAKLFEAQHPDARVQFNFAASGVLLQQIANGAPVDVFASADQPTMDQAQARGLIQTAQRRDFAANALVLIVPAASTNVPRTLDELTQPAYRRVAVGLPASVPAGRYTKQVLEQAGLWAAIEPRIIGTQNVRQALDYVSRGEVDAGFVYATDAALMSDKVRVAVVAPAAVPILYPAAPVAASDQPELAQAFVAFLGSEAAQAVLARHGFGRP